MIQLQCNCCHKVYNIDISLDDYHQWKEGNQLIQNTFPNLSASDRELLISNTCGYCFDEMFNVEKGEEESK